MAKDAHLLKDVALIAFIHPYYSDSYYTSLNFASISRLMIVENLNSCIDSGPSLLYALNSPQISRVVYK